VSRAIETAPTGTTTVNGILTRTTVNCSRGATEAGGGRGLGREGGRGRHRRECRCSGRRHDPKLMGSVTSDGVHTVGMWGVAA
jgi:hypothetical protein